MKKTLQLLIGLLLLSATGFTQQKENKLTTSQNQPVFRNEAAVNFYHGYRREVKVWQQRVISQPVNQALFDTGNAPGEYGFIQSCIPKRILIDNIIKQLFKDEK